MFEKKSDSRDEMIALLRQDKERLELRVAELTNQVIALSNRAAYRELHPREPFNTGETPAEPFVPKHLQPFKPALSFSDVQEAFDRIEKESA